MAYRSPNSALVAKHGENIINLLDPSRLICADENNPKKDEKERLKQPTTPQKYSILVFHPTSVLIL